MLSPRSRGKGSRRLPGRDGGRRKQRIAQWRKQAVHAVDGADELHAPLVPLTYTCPRGKSPAEGIYLFDQAMACTGIRYQAELYGSRFFPVFIIRVPTESARTVTHVITKVEKRHLR